MRERVDSLVYAGETDKGTGIYVVNQDGSGRRKLTGRIPLAAGYPPASLPQWSPRGDKILFKTSEPDSLWTIDAHGGGAEQIVVEGNLWWRPSWSPDGSAIAYFDAQDRVAVVDRNGRRRRTIALPADTYLIDDPTLDWSADGRYLAFEASEETDAYDAERVFAADLQTGEMHDLSSRRIAEDYRPSWSPIGQQIALLENHSDPDTGGESYTLVLADSDGQNRRALARKVAAFAWSPDAKALVYAVAIREDPADEDVLRCDLSIVDAVSRQRRHFVSVRSPGGCDDPQWSPKGGHIAVETYPGTEAVNTNPGTEVFDLTGNTVARFPNLLSPSWAPDGRRIALEKKGVIVVGDVRSGLAAPLTVRRSFDWAPEWSPDGSSIAFVRTPDRTSSTGVVHVIGADGGDSLPLGQGANPTWSPKSDSVLVSREAGSGGAGTYLLASDGSGERFIVRGAEPAWSPDGSTLAFVRQGSYRDSVGLAPANPRLYTLRLDGGDPVELSRRDAQDQQFFEPVFSPDGTKIAYASEDNSAAHEYGGSQVHVVLLRDKSTTALPTSSLASVSWAPDGEHLLISERDRIASIKVDGSESSTETSGLRDSYYSQAAWSPDGRDIAFVHGSGILAAVESGSDKQEPRVLARGALFDFDWRPLLQPHKSRQPICGVDRGPVGP